MSVSEEIDKNGWPCACQKGDKLGRITHIRMNHPSVQKCQDCGCRQADILKADDYPFSASVDAPPGMTKERPRDQLAMFVVYCGPSDFPEKFVVRRWVGETPDPAPFGLFDTVGAARAALPEGLVNIGRRELDDPVIVEVWI